MSAFSTGSETRDFKRASGEPPERPLQSSKETKMESNRNDKYWYVRLDDVPRAVKFPFPLKELGFFWNKVEPEASFDWKLEFTLRLSSLEQFAVDEIGGVTYRTEYPNVILKLPGVVHKYAVPEPRDAVYFAYSTALADAMTAAKPLPDAARLENQTHPENMRNAGTRETADGAFPRIRSRRPAGFARVSAL